MKTKSPLAQRLYISVNRYFENELTNHAGAVAYYFLLSIIPIILLMLTIFDFFLSSHAAFSEEFFELLSSFSPHLNKELLEKFGLSSGAAKAVGLIGAFNLLWTSRLILVSIQRAFDVIFQADKNRNFVITLFISIFIIPAVFLLVTLSSMLRFALEFISGFLIDAGFSAELISRVGGFSFVLPIIAAFIGAFVCYRYLPQNRPSTSSAFQGALLFVFLLVIIKYAFGFVVDIAKLNMLYGFIGALIVLLIWVYFICQIFFICAEYAFVCDKADTLIINRMFNLQNMQKQKFFEKKLFGDNAKVFKRYSEQYDEDTVIFKQGEKSKDVYYIYEGQVKIFLDGIAEPLATITDGNIFGEIASLLDSPRTSTAVVCKGSTVLKISPETFNELLSINTTLSLRTINSLCERLKDMNVRV